MRTFAGGLDKNAAKFLFGREDGEPFNPNYLGTGWPVADESKEVAVLLKEVEEQTAELKTLLDENRKMQMEIATQLIEVERLIERERDRKRQLEEQLKGEKKTK